MSYCCIAGSSWLTTPKFITNAAARSFRPLFNICSAADRFLQPTVVQLGMSRTDRFSTGNRPPLGGNGCSSRWPKSSGEEMDMYYDLLNILEKAGYHGSYKVYNRHGGLP
ncbi:hypothetical protein P3S68_005889 [Capsicum galapagoense]